MHWPHFLVTSGNKDIQGSLKLHSPEHIDLEKLADLTASSLTVLKPWCNADHQSAALQKITAQAHTYTEAIHFSISAAQQGYNVANDAVTMSQSVSAGGKTEDELQEFAFSMLRLGQEAYLKAQECLLKFRNVRRVMNSLIEEAKASEDHTLLHVQDDLKQLEDGIPVFEGLVANISTYISWWHWLELKTNAELESAGQLRVRYGAMRQKAVELKWKELQEAFVVYTTKIQELEDTHPELFKSFNESARVPIESKELSGDYIDHHAKNPKLKSNRRLGRIWRVVTLGGLFSCFRSD